MKSLFLCLLLFLSFAAEALSQTCCQRNVGTEIAFPYDVNSQIYNDMGYIGTGSGWDEVFLSIEHGGGPSLKCPRIDLFEMNPIKPPPVPHNLDYRFSGRFAVTGDGSPPRGYSVTLNVSLIDVGRGAAVKSGTSSWTCVPREAGYCLKMRLQKTRELAKTFQPLDKIIYDYERIPETLTVKLEKDPILAGEEMKIILTDIKDIDSKPSQPWQRILVKAEKGKILNGESYGEFKVFKVGNGTVEIEYKAPNECKNTVETITILNSCSIKPDLPPYPEREITKKKFDIFCVEGKIKIEEDWSSLPANPINPRSGMSPPQCAYTEGPINKTPGWITFRLRPTKDPCMYEVVEFDKTPSVYNERYIPANRKCCDYKYHSQKNYKLTSDGTGKTIVDFRNNPARPLSVYISNTQSYTAECLNFPLMPKIDYSGDWDLHNNAWPLKNGFVDDIRSAKFELVIDDKEVEKLRNRCKKGK